MDDAPDYLLQSRHCALGESESQLGQEQFQPPTHEQVNGFQEI